MPSTKEIYKFIKQGTANPDDLLDEERDNVVEMADSVPTKYERPEPRNGKVPRPSNLSPLSPGAADTSSDIATPTQKMPNLSLQRKSTNMSRVSDGDKKRNKLMS